MFCGKMPDWMVQMPACLRRFDQRPKQPQSDAASRDVGVDVHGVLDDSGVHATG